MAGTLADSRGWGCVKGDIGNNDFDGSDANPLLEVSHAYTPELEDFMQIHYQIRDSVTHSQLQ